MLPARRLGALAGVIAFTATAGTALAATRTYCVGSPPGCSGTAESTLTDALTAANADTSGSDQIILPAGTQSAINPYVYSGTAPLEIDGQGTSSIVTLIGGISNAAVISDTDNAPSIALHALEVKIPTGSDGTADGIHLTNSKSATVSNVTVLDNASMASAGIVLNNGGTVSASTVEMPPNSSASNTALQVPSGTATVTDSELTGNTGVLVQGGATASILRCDLETNGFPALYVVDGVVSIGDSFLTSASNAAIDVLSISKAASVIGSFLTIGPNLQGIGVAAQVEGSANATVGLDDSIIANPLVNSIYTHRTSGTGVPSVTTDSSDYDHTTIATYNGAAYVPGAHDFSAYVDPQFADAGDNDYHLLAGSPLINYDARSLGLFDSPNDLSGFPRPTGGPQDVGDYQHPPNPSVSASSTVPSHTTLYPGTVIAYSASGSEPYPSDPLTYAWKFDDGTTAAGQNVNHSFSTPGTHTATVTATDKYGFSGNAQTSVTITPTPPGIPVVGHLTESHKKFRASRKVATITAKRHRAPIGTVFTFTVDQKAWIVLTFTRGHHGVGGFELRGHPGTDHIRFYGRVGRQTLKPGKYKLNLRAANDIAPQSAPATIYFTIVR